MADVHVVTRLAEWLGVLVVGAAAVVLVVPDRLGLTTTTPVTQLIAFRFGLGLVAAVAGLGALALAVSRSREGRSPRPARPSPLAPAVLAAVLVVCGVLHLGVLAGRGWAQTAGPVPPGPGSVTVLAINTQGGAASPRTIASVAATAGADVIALPETTPDLAARTAEALATHGLDVQVFTNGPDRPPEASTALLVRDTMGRYAQVPGRIGANAVRADPVDGAGPRLVAVHPTAPIPGNLHRWERALGAAVEFCRSTPGAIVAGDFNATLDHPPMRALAPCIDGAASLGWRGAGGYGTWPAAVPALFAAPIDHVLVDGSRWRAESARVVAVRGSDHRGVIVRLVPVPAED